MSQKFMEYLGLLMHQHSLTLGGGEGMEGYGLQPCL